MTEGAGGPGHLASAADLDRWGADNVSARTVFPRLMRRIIRQTNDQVVELEMRADKGAGYKGFDGRVRASKGTPLVPDGFSVWELGVGEDPKSKADDDYEKRTTDPLDVDPSSTTFVFATARRWSGKNDWASEKRAEEIWADVRAFDADDIETAFEEAPAAHYLVSEALGKAPAGIRSIEGWWDAFARGSNPNLTPAMVLSGRADHAAELLRILREDVRITTISASSVDEVLAFVAATLLSAPEDDRESLLARALIVHDRASLRRLEHTSNLLILLPYEDELSRESQLVRAHHVVLLATQNVPSDIKLAKIDRAEFQKRLTEAGVEDEDQAGKLAAAADRSLVSFQHAAPSGGRRPRVWSSHYSTAVVRRAWMLGGWHEGRSGDLDVLERVFGTGYDAARDELSPLTQGEDPLFALVGESWTLTSVEDAWPYGSPSLNQTDLKALEAAIQTVLAAVDPALELAMEERWRASVYGKTRIHSSELRRGLATSLALCGTYGADCIVGTRSLSDWAESMVALLLHRANQDPTGHLWASLSDVLPLLAEAAPNVFLRALGEAVDGDEPLMRTVFQDETDAFSVSSPHTGLLWALETTAWSTDHAALTAGLLARLAEIDPGGRLSNRPINSLLGMFRPWLPQTSLSVGRRLKVLEAIERDHPDVAFELMVGLLPEPHQIGSYSHSPRFREWKAPSV